MKRVLIPSCGATSWRQLLADPDKHWVRGASAFETAVSWERAQATARGLPEPIAAVLDQDQEISGAEVLFALPEHKVQLEGRGRASQNDVWVLLKSPNGLISMAVEGKAGEAFGPSVRDWLVNASDGKKTRLESLCRLVGATHPPEAALRYQLFHRTASALIEADRVGAEIAVLMVQSFRSDPASFADYMAFAAALGVTVAEGRLLQVPRVSETSLYLGWASCDPATDEVVASVV